MEEIGAKTVCGRFFLQRNKASKQANSFETRKDSQSINKIKKEKKYLLARARLHLIFLAERERKKTHN